MAGYDFRRGPLCARGSAPEISLDGLAEANAAEAAKLHTVPCLPAAGGRRASARLSFAAGRQARHQMKSPRDGAAKDQPCIAM